MKFNVKVRMETVVELKHCDEVVFTDWTWRPITTYGTTWKKIG